MADDSKYPKRVNYFNSQMLYDGDFRDEQKYHRTMRLVHNSSLHAWGIVSGLEVKNGRKGNEVLIGSGMAIDNQGQEIILPEDLVYPFSARKVERYLTIAYKDEPDEQSAKLNIKGEKDAYARREERPAIELLQDQPPKDGKAILLAKVTLDGKGDVWKIDGDPTKSERSRFAGLNPNTELSVRSLLVRGAVLAQQLFFADENGTSYPDNWIGMASNISDAIKWLHIGGITDGVGDARKRRLALLADNVYLRGNLGIDKLDPAAKLEVAGTLTASADDAALVGLKIAPNFQDGGKSRVKHYGLIVADGNVGIGITDPKSSLSVKGGIAVGTTYAGTLAAQANDLLVEGKVGIGTNDPGSNALRAGPGSVRFELGSGQKLSLGGNGAFEIDKPGVVGGRFIVTDGGKVGIGTTNPTEDLQFRDLVADSNVLICRKAASQHDPGSVPSELAFGTIDSVFAGIRIRSERKKGTSGNSQYICFETHDAFASHGERMRITPDGNIGIGKLDPEAKLEVAGTVQATTFIATNPMQHRMYPSDPIVFQDIFDAKDNAKVISKCGNPQYDEDRHRTNKWQGRRMIKFGSANEQDGNGAEINIAGDYDTVWLRIPGEQWIVMKVKSGAQVLGEWAGGFRSTNCYCPDGSLHDSQIFTADRPGGLYNIQLVDFAAHEWVPIPVRGFKTVQLTSIKGGREEFMLSGLAFSKNPWKHATQSAYGYHRGLNGAEAIAWNTHNFNNDIAGQIDGDTNKVLKVPVVPSGRDKLLYLIEHNSNWNGCQHTGITINGNPIDRFVATYDNPFARHWNSKSYCRYIAARIPAKLVESAAEFLSVRIDMTGITKPIFFREIGTHDLDVPT